MNLVLVRLNFFLLLLFFNRSLAKTSFCLTSQVSHREVIGSKVHQMMFDFEKLDQAQPSEELAQQSSKEPQLQLFQKTLADLNKQLDSCSELKTKLELRDEISFKYCMANERGNVFLVDNLYENMIDRIKIKCRPLAEELALATKLLPNQGWSKIKTAQQQQDEKLAALIAPRQTLPHQTLETVAEDLSLAGRCRDLTKMVLEIVNEQFKQHIAPIINVTPFVTAEVPGRIVAIAYGLNDLITKTKTAKTQADVYARTFFNHLVRIEKTKTKLLSHEQPYLAAVTELEKKGQLSPGATRIARYTFGQPMGDHPTFIPKITQSFTLPKVKCEKDGSSRETLTWCHKKVSPPPRPCVAYLLDLYDFNVQELQAYQYKQLTELTRNYYERLYTLLTAINGTTSVPAAQSSLLKFIIHESGVHLELEEAIRKAKSQWIRNVTMLSSTFHTLKALLRSSTEDYEDRNFF